MAGWATDCYGAMRFLALCVDDPDKVTNAPKNNNSGRVWQARPLGKIASWCLDGKEHPDRANQAARLDFTHCVVPGGQHNKPPPASQTPMEFRWFAGPIVGRVP
jgi:hypothetical protein